MEEKIKITYGGWYQRTTLHLSEIYDLLAFGSSKLNLSKDELTKYRDLLNLESVSREAGYLEFVKARTKDGIEIRYYEDGLYILETDSENIKEGAKVLEVYHDTILNPAISYIFSLGAPTPKILANIKTYHPVVINIVSDNPENFEVDSNNFGEVYSKIISHDIAVYKTPRHLFLISKPNSQLPVSELTEMQIFFREFKDQLEKYLNIHRSVWEEISSIKEQKTIGGDQVEPIRSKLDSYQKTISLINNRINQMGSYIRTRSSISKGFKIEDRLVTLFQFKFEVLTDTLDYIKEIWKMTNDYLSSAIQNIVEIKNQGTNRSIQSLQVITSMGVIAGIIGYLSKDIFPKFTIIGTIYFAIIILFTWFINFSVNKIYKKKRYILKLPDRAKSL